MSATTKFRDNVVAFTALPNSVRLVLLLVFLNSFRSFGLRFVQQLYLTNEFGFDDLQAASVLGTSASLHVAFGLIGAVLTDAIGVRRVGLTALSISVVGRGLLAFGRSGRRYTRRSTCSRRRGKRYLRRASTAWL